ncbi:hypothetical protein [uncultured Acinetobacter sp.]|uniref:hypothetical protein n=1 Tax=uncultured Acinetobacter sp. TaxID=165433 RepID=UPI002588315A|nr:hypothetical protein [uncultured Acinetobacter sp.]
MKKETKIFLIYTCVYIISISILVFFSTLWLYSYNNINDALKESWTIAFSCISALTTIGAAIIAAYLFNDWRDQHNKQVQNSLALQVFSAFSIFEKNLREFSLYLSHLENLRSSYDNYEMTWDLINRNEEIIYIRNIQSKKDEMDLNFYALIDQLRNFYVFSNDLKQYEESYNRYYDKFIYINRSSLPIHTLIDQLVDYNTKYIGYTDLKNMIDSLEIKKIITNLNA